MDAIFIYPEINLRGFANKAILHNALASEL
jgi:hypothetical protein